ncbi:MAG: hypothetical protein ACK5KK_05800, partial [Microbacterium sp.]
APVLAHAGDPRQSPERVGVSEPMTARPHDPRWPRAGDWPAPNGVVDAVLLGVPAFRTSLSASGAHALPG